MRVNNMMSFLANMRPQSLSQSKAEASPSSQGEDGVAGFDPASFAKGLSDAKVLSAKDLLSKYDLHDINREDLTTLAMTLRNRGEISDDQYINLDWLGTSAFPDSNTEKGDFIGFLQNRLANLGDAGSARLNANAKDILTKAPKVSTEQSLRAPIAS